MRNRLAVASQIGSAQLNGGEPEQTAAPRNTMDIVYVGLTFALFGLALGLIRLCERV